VNRPAIFVLFAAFLASCHAAAPADSPSAAGGGAGDAIAFAYGTTEGGELSSATTRGRATAILFITTYDLASQLVAKRLDDALHRHVPRANGGAVVLETPQYVVMADTFRTSLRLSYPVAMADTATLGGDGPFGKVDAIPLLVVLDRDGREVWRKSGALTPREIERALALGSARGSSPGP
jgi:hypothetical protein